MTRPLRAEISLSALQHNLQQARNAAPSSKVIAVIKANGYGHDMQIVAHALNTADAFAVASIEEAINLREAGVHQPIILLEGFFDEDDLLLLQAYSLQPVIHSMHQIEMLEAASLTYAFDVWMKIDTGMHRLGFSTMESKQAYARLHECDAVETIHAMTHFACADDQENLATAYQIALFKKTIEEAGINSSTSLANSAGILGFPASHADWIRPGIMLYGASPFVDDDIESLSLKPVMNLVSELISVREVMRGESVGYGGDWICPENMMVGVVACGYGDGYPRHAPSGTPVLVNGQRASLIGRVSMDMITVDLRDCEAQVGDSVLLWGEGLPADEIALHAETIAYELFCNVAPRVPRVEIK